MSKTDENIEMKTKKKEKTISERTKEIWANYGNQIRIAGIAVIISSAISLIIYFCAGERTFSNVSGFLQYVTVILAVMAWINTIIILEKRKKTKVTANSDDLILAVSLSDFDVDSDVLKFINTTELKNVKGVSIVDEGSDRHDSVLVDTDNMYLSVSGAIPGALTIKKKNLMPKEQDAVPQYMNDFKKCIQRVFEIMNSNNMRKIHIFYGGPIEIAAFMMAPFTNKIPVILYRKIKGEDYVKLGEVWDPNDVSQNTDQTDKTNS